MEIIICKSHCLVSFQRCQQATKSQNWQTHFLFQWRSNNISACARQEKITPNPSPLVPKGLLTKALCKAVLPGPVEDREAPKTLAWMPKKKRWHEFKVLNLTRTHKPGCSQVDQLMLTHVQREATQKIVLHLKTLLFSFNSVLWFLIFLPLYSENVKVLHLNLEGKRRQISFEDFRAKHARHIKGLLVSKCAFSASVTRLDRVAAQD